VDVNLILQAGFVGLY